MAGRRGAPFRARAQGRRPRRAVAVAPRRQPLRTLSHPVSGYGRGDAQRLDGSAGNARHRVPRRQVARASRGGRRRGRSRQPTGAHGPRAGARRRRQGAQGVFTLHAPAIPNAGSSSATTTSISIRSAARRMPATWMAGAARAMSRISATSSGSRNPSNALQACGGVPIAPIELDADTRHLDCNLALLTLSDKVWHATGLGHRRMADSIDMLCIARNKTRAEIAAEPGIFTTINANSPRRFDGPMLEGLMGGGRRTVRRFRSRRSRCPAR